jgi:DNA gyrase/topoisomerase IV subunit B
LVNLGDGSSQDDGIYVLIKEIIDNSIDEFVMGNGRTIEVAIKDQKVTIRDYGRGMPLGKGYRLRKQRSILGQNTIVRYSKKQ